MGTSIIHKNRSEVCASSECTGEAVYLHKLVLVVDVRIVTSFVLFVGM